MDHARARFPNLSLDPKRIVATSVAIVVHVLVLMLLLLPMQIAPYRPVVDDPIITFPEFRTIPPLIPVPPPPQPSTPAPRQPVQPQATPVNSTPSPVDTYTPPALPNDAANDNYQPPVESAFAQISADFAPPPPYPAQALRRGLSGVVTLKVRVDAQGRPVDAVVESSSGSLLLDNAALKFVLARWHFIPATRSGATIEAYALVPINFVIEK